MTNLIAKKVLVGITGGIAAYKAAELVRVLVKAGADIRVVMTRHAEAFITPLTLQALSGHPVRTALLDTHAEAGMGHIEMAKWADHIIIAPASANIIAKLASGQADDLLSTLCLATQASIAVAPAMNQAMWLNAATQANIATLLERGIKIWGPDLGDQACGDNGPGRLLEPDQIVAQLRQTLDTSLSGKTIVITAGPTREPLDPVRFISNHSSGKMGYALAQAAQQKGARVLLISGPTAIKVPDGVETHFVETALEMHAVALKLSQQAHIVIAAAAVADYRPAQVSPHKIKKGAAAEMSMTLIKNPDIVADIAAMKPRPFMVGFAAETEHLLEQAKSKRLSKQLDIVIANDVTQPNAGFNSDDNSVWLIDANTEIKFESAPKIMLARTLINHITQRYFLSLSISHETL